MRNFFKLLRFESKRNLRPITIYIVLLFLGVSLIFTQFGIDESMRVKKDISSFIEVEQKLVSDYANIYHYGVSGFRLISMHSDLFSLFYNSTPLSDLEVSIDKIVRLKINKPQSGAIIFKKPLGSSNLDFSWYFLFFGTALVFIWGFIGLRNREHLRFMLSFTTPRVLYGAIILSKIVLILCFLIVSYLLVVGLFLINGIGLSMADLSYLGIFFLVAFLTLILFLILGAICGSVKSMFKASVFAILTWFVLIILFPEISNIGLSKHTGTIFESIYAHELKKLEIFSKAEEAILKEVSKYKTPEDIKIAYKRLIDDYLENDFQKIVGLEEKMVRDTMKAAKEVHFYNIFTPVTFYKSVNNEISGCAFNGHIEFYKSNIKHYEGFVRYCLENTMKRNRPKDSPFIKNEKDYIFHLESSLPKYFGVGVVLNVVYILVAFGVGYLRFGRVVFAKPEKAALFKGIDLKLLSGKHVVIRLYEDQEDVANQVFNVFSGHDTKFSGKISLDGESIVGTGKKSFAYLPDPKVIPGEIKAAALLGLSGLSRGEIKKLKAEPGNKLNKTFSGLARVERVELLLKTVVNEEVKIYLLHNLMTGLTIDELKEVFKHLESKDNTIVEMNLEQACNLHPDHYQYYGINFDGTTFKERLYHKM